MNIWIVGSSGMLAHAWKSRLTALAVPWCGTDLDLDITCRERVLEFAANRQLTHIVNCAAYTAVDDAEANEAKARAINADGAGHLAEAAALVGADFVHYSTDYVFDGKGCAPYREDAATAPVGAYGRTKLLGEHRVLATLGQGRAGRGVYLVRTSWLFGPHGNNFVRTILDRMHKLERLRVVADQKGRPTYTFDLAETTLALLGLGHPQKAEPGIYHVANAGETTWHGFTMAIWEQARALGFALRVNAVDAVTTAEFPRPAPRPSYSVLCTERVERHLGHPLRPFRATLGEYLPLLQADETFCRARAPTSLKPA